MDTSKWISFFNKAGLPFNVAANYALIFSENRIQVDMLLDLSKEYLYDMGIRVMGDVIAILKHAREYHNQLAQQRIIGKPSPPVVGNKTAIAERLVGHYTKPSTPQPVRIPIKDRISSPAKPKIISLKQKPLPTRVRKVPPEEEGGYRIKMPLGTTERTRKILQRQAAAAKKSVFSRLGEGAVSSSTDVGKVSGSVFKRLGAGSKLSMDEVPTSTMLLDIERPKTALQYKGIFKTNAGLSRTIMTTGSNKTITRTVMQPTKRAVPTANKAARINHINSLLLQNSPPKTISLRASRFSATAGNLTKTANVRSRLGGNVDARNVVRSNMMSVRGKGASVFNRIGM